MHTDSCVFCAITEHTQSADILYEDELTMVILDHDPITPGHMLVLPKGNIQTFDDLSKEQGTRLFEVLQRCIQALNHLSIYDGVRLMQNNGAIQDVPHVHFHVFGRNETQDVEISYPPVQPLSQEQHQQLLRSVQHLPNPNS